jgi:exodeoxyribonuclease III
MRIVTFNANGYAPLRQGTLTWLDSLPAWDVFCVQELKADLASIPSKLHRIGPAQGHFYPAEKKGYAGTALWSPHPARIRRGFGVAEFDREGRYLEADLGPLIVVSLYLPSGSAGPERQASKDRFLDAFLPVLERLRQSGKEVILCGDFNIAHQAIDLKNWKSNQKNSGFLPHERAWLTRLFEELGFVDVFRRLDPRPEQYTWWSQRGQARAKNVGWRIDYQIATPGIAARARSVRIDPEPRLSDHAPLTIDYDFELTG